MSYPPQQSWPPPEPSPHPVQGDPSLAGVPPIPPPPPQNPPPPHGGAPFPPPYGPPPPKKSHTGLIVKIVLVAVVFLMLLAAFVITKLSDSSDDEMEPQSAATTSKPSATSSAPRPSKTQRTPTPTADYFESKVAVWQQPISPAGWRTEVFGEDGIYKYVHDFSGCQITLRQSNGAASAKASGETPIFSVDAIFDNVAGQVSNFNVVANYSVNFMRGDSAPISFPSKVARYDGNDGVEYMLHAGAQWFGDVELFFATACNSTAWVDEANTIQDFLDQVRVLAY